jgi:hypothetical protein
MVVVKAVKFDKEEEQAIEKVIDMIYQCYCIFSIFLFCQMHIFWSIRKYTWNKKKTDEQKQTDDFFLI